MGVFKAHCPLTHSMGPSETEEGGLPAHRHADAIQAYLGKAA